MADDMIRRSELLSVFKRWERVPDYNEAERHIIKAAIYETECIPAVDAVEVVHGEWIPFMGETGVEEFGYKEFTTLGFGCSVCHADIDVSEEYFRYCPMCGACMDGRREDGDT